MTYRAKRFSLPLIASALVLVAAVAATAVLLINQRMAQCQYIPIVAPELLPNAALLPDAAAPQRPNGWSGAASGVELQHPARDGRGFDLDGDDRGLQLIGIANYVETPAVRVRAGQSYCFVGSALSDSQKSATRLRAVFRWMDAQGQPLGSDTSAWQAVQLWHPEASGWSPIRAAFRAPPRAAQLRVRIQPASDDRVYLDAMHVRPTRLAGGHLASTAQETATVTVQPWPHGYQAALAFSFDWETTMGGLVHTRTALDGNLYADQNPRQRGMWMRDGITTTLDLFRPYGIKATYFANGYNFLTGNQQRRTFMGDPIFPWASTANGWKNDWSAEKWFGSDPYATIESAPDYYFGDLVQLLRREGHEIQSHTFSHLHAGLASPAELHDDLSAWNEVAQQQDIPPARTLAFPWSSSAGMSDVSWSVLDKSGITSVTRTNWTQDQYDLFKRDGEGVTTQTFCMPVPGHERILACPDFYLTERTARTAVRYLDQVVAAGGMIDYWAHTEEVVTDGQREAWGTVIRHAADLREEGKLWIAPFSEIADWQQSLADIQVDHDQDGAESGPLSLTVSNSGSRPLDGITLRVPFEINGISGGATMLGPSTIALGPLRGGETAQLVVTRK